MLATQLIPEVVLTTVAALAFDERNVARENLALLSRLRSQVRAAARYGARRRLCVPPGRSR